MHFYRLRLQLHIWQIEKYVFISYRQNKSNTVFKSYYRPHKLCVFIKVANEKIKAIPVTGRGYLS
jgi:hypothetical protein